MRTHRDQVDAAVRQYSGIAGDGLPDWLNNPRNEHEFALAMAVLFASGRVRRVLGCEPGDAGPEYDSDGFLTGWYGITWKPGT